MRHDALRLQNRLIGTLTLIVLAWVAWSQYAHLRDRHVGASYFTLTPNVQGLQAGSLVTLNGFEIGQVTGVALEGDGQQPRNAAELVFRVRFQVLSPVVFPSEATFLGIEEVNPVAPARLVVKVVAAAPGHTTDRLLASTLLAQTLHECPPSESAHAGVIADGGCIPILATEEDMRPGLSGLIAAGTETLRALQRTVAEFGVLGEEFRVTNERLAAMLSDKPGTLYRLPAALEEAALRMAGVTESLHDDLVERVDRMITPETIATLVRALNDLEELIATSGYRSQETLENLAAITRGLNQITWQLEHDPIGFLRGSGAGAR